MRYFLVVILIVSSCANCSSDGSNAMPDELFRNKTNNESESWRNPYLPNNIEPIHYELHHSPRFYGNSTIFFGHVYIHINIFNWTDTFIVHSKGLKVGDRRVYNGSGTEMHVSAYFYFHDNDYYVIQTWEPLIGKATLLLDYTGYMTLVTDAVFNCTGLYKIPYIKSPGYESCLHVSDFGPRTSRLTFPSFDEPRFKATFEISLRHVTDFTPLSNMPVEKHIDQVRHVLTTVFKTTPRISSHQVVFALTDFSNKTTTVDGKQYRIWAEEKHMGRVDYALEVTAKLQNYLSQELNISYPLEILDQIAVPKELLTCQGDSAPKKESRLISYHSRDGDSVKYETLRTISHSLAHNYFGNLVTCRFWDQAWLNEGLSTFYDIRAITEVDPTFEHENYIFGDRLDAAIFAEAGGLDIKLIQTPKSINETKLTLDYILKIKGAAILRMVENFIGADAFKSGIRRYLTKYANDVVVTDDLWNVLQEEIGDKLDIKMIMKDWVETRGIPVIYLELAVDNSIRATQTQFLLDSKAIPDPEKRWHVPLTYQTQAGIRETIWMFKSEAFFEVPLSSKDEWVEFNYNRTGYYLVNYDENLLDRIVKQLIRNHTVFSEISRSKLLSDALAMAGTKDVGYNAFLSLTRYAVKEKGLTPWIHIHEGFSQLFRILKTPRYCCLQSYVSILTASLMHKLQVKDEGSYIERKLRPMIMSLSCQSGHEGCVENATREFRAWIRNESSKAVSLEYMREVYCIGIAISALESDWKTTFERFHQATSEREALNLLRALACSKNVTLLESLLDFSMKNSTANDIRFYIAVYIMSNPSQSDCIWNWLKVKYADIHKELGKGYPGYYLTVAVERFHTKERYKEVTDFYSVYPDFSEEDKNATESIISRNIVWMESHYNAIVDWFDRNPHVK